MTVAASPLGTAHPQQAGLAIDQGDAPPADHPWSWYRHLAGVQPARALRPPSWTRFLATARVNQTVRPSALAAGSPGLRRRWQSCRKFLQNWTIHWLGTVEAI